MATSTKYDPNENYAREILQLFSIGTEKLNQDGTTQNDPGTGLPLPTYDQSVIDQFKRVYTGWYIPEIPCPAPNGADICYDFRSPMSYDADYHDTDVKTLFQGFVPSPTVLPADQTGDQDLNGAIDAIFHHPNVGPYLVPGADPQPRDVQPEPGLRRARGRFLQRQRRRSPGSLWAVVKAILLDPEARLRSRPIPRTASSGSPSST